MATLKKARGGFEVFTAAQNDALRKALRELQKRRHYSQLALAQLLGIKQQNVGRLLNHEDVGFSYLPATRLVRSLRFAGVDSFFRHHNVALPAEPQHARSA